MGKAAPARVARATIRVVSGVVDIIVLVVVAVLVVLSCYTIWDSRQLGQDASPARYALYKPSAATPAVDGSAPLAQLQAINPDVQAWLTVYNTGIDYPVVQGRDNSHYLNRDATGKYSGAGSIFVDYRNRPGFADFSTIVYGHHMRSGMFAEIGLFYEQSYFDARPYGALYFNGHKHGLEFFAFLHTSAYDDSVYTTPVEPHGEQAYLTQLLREARFVRPEVTVGTDDHIVLLSTCSSRTTNGRDILVGKIVDQARPDPSLDQASGSASTSIIDSLPGLLAGAPTWVKVAASLVIPWWLLLIVLLLRRRTRARQPANH